MTNPSYRHILMINDRSGSMERMRRDTEGGVKAFVEEQRQLPGRTTFSLYQFDTEHDEVMSFAEFGPGEFNWELIPRGGTALLDAVGFAITRTGEALAAMDDADRPGEVYALIATDGDENRSREYTLPQVNQMITRQQDKYGWKFTFLGANQDSFKAAGEMGIPSCSTIDYSTTASGAAFASASSMTTRSTLGGGFGYTTAEREQAAGS